MTCKIVEGVFMNKDIIHNWFYSTIIISRRQQGPNTNSNHPIITLLVLNQKVPQKQIWVLHILKYPNINSNYLYLITKWSMKVNYMAPWVATTVAFKTHRYYPQVIGRYGNCRGVRYGDRERGGLTRGGGDHDWVGFDEDITCASRDIHILGCY